MLPIHQHEEVVKTSDIVMRWLFVVEGRGAIKIYIVFGIMAKLLLAWCRIGIEDGPFAWLFLVDITSIASQT